MITDNLVFDGRKDQTYDAYNLDYVDVGVGTKVDCYDRYMMRKLTMRESLRIIEKCLNQIPSGDVQSDEIVSTLPEMLQ
ncbi:MAG: hypothetical protein FJ333_00245 [Sphingomonadales bacterium]|nr:hypothetical protein [Sphingomonadales bacterium]